MVTADLEKEIRLFPGLSPCGWLVCTSGGLGSLGSRAAFVRPDLVVTRWV